MSERRKPMSLTACKSCGEEVIDHVRLLHWTDGANGDGYGHDGLCCDCFDLSMGMPLDQLNVERAAKGKLPLPVDTKPKDD